MEDNEEKECEHCKKNVAVKNYTLHSLHCMKFIQLCEICHEPVHRNEFDAHLNDSHSIEDCSYCGLPIEKWKLLSHKEDECYKRPSSCEFCDERLPFNDMMQHKNICESRTKECISCHLYVKNKEQKNHLKSCEKKNKIRKLIVCKYCEMEVLQENYLDHEISCGSRTEKCSTCLKYVTFKDLEHHQNRCRQNKDSDTMGICNHCKQGFPWSIFQEHQSECGVRFVQCNLCNDYFEIQEMKYHLELCKMEKKHNSYGVCEHCEVKIPSGMYNEHVSKCGDRFEKCSSCYNYVKLKDIENHIINCEGLIQEKKRNNNFGICEHCEVKIPSGLYNEHVSKCGDRIEKCSSCYDFVKLKNLDNHRINCVGSDSYKPPKFCEYCELEILFEDFDFHKAGCGAQVEKCFKCGRMVKRRNAASHLKICPESMMEDDEENAEKSTSVENAIELNEEKPSIPCTFCNVLFPLDCLNDHTETCVARTDQCPDCNEIFMFQNKDQHKRTCKPELNEEKPSIPCTFCNVLFPLDCLNDHTETCVARTDQCPDCNEIFMFHNKDRHKRTCKPKKGQKFSVCEHCKVKFHHEFLEEHLKLCKERIELCKKCNLHVMFRDKEKHLNSCDKVDDSEECPLCNVNYPSSDYKTHYEECFRSNSATHYYAESMMPSYRTKDVKYSVNLKSCPYCSKQVQSKQFENHKTYCSKALKVCQFCKETFHVKGEMEHYENCDAYKMSKGREQHMHNIHTDENFGRENEKSCFCQHCQNHILIEEFENHVTLCEDGKKLCKFCGLTFDKNKEKSHLETCIVLLKETYNTGMINNQGVYSSIYPQLQPSKKKHLECCFCKKLIPYKDFDSHVGKCRSSRICPYCKARISKKDVDHIDLCLRNLEKGAKPKYKEVVENKQNKPGVFQSLFNKFWSNPAGSSNDKSVSRNWSLHYSDSNNEGLSPTSHLYPNLKACKNMQPSTPMTEEILIPCEFCSKRIPMDEIIKHETACEPSLVSLPSARFESREINETLQAKWGNVHQKEVLDSEDIHYEETSNKSYHEATPPQVQKEHINNYTYLQNLNPKPYATESTEENQQIHNLSKYDISDKNNQLKSPSFEENETVSCFNEAKKQTVKSSKKSFILESEKSFNEAKKQTVKSSKKSFILESEKSGHGKDNHANTHKSVIYDDKDKAIKTNLISEPTDLDFCNSKKATEPGEFLRNHIICEQFDSKKSKEATILDSNVSHSWQNIDMESDNLFEKEVSDNYWNKSEENKSLGHYDSKIINHSRKSYGEKSVCNEKNICDSKRLKNEMNINTTDKLEQACPTKNFSVGNFDESMKKLKTKVNRKELEFEGIEVSKYYSSNSFKNDYDNIGNDHSAVSEDKVERNPRRNADCYKKNESLTTLKADLGYNEEYSLISSSKMQGPVKIERLSLKKTNSYSEMDKCLEPVGKLKPNEDNMLEKPMEQIIKLQRYLSFSSSNIPVEEKLKKQEEIKQVNLNHNQSFDRLNYFNRKQYSEKEILADQPMEIDDENNYATKKSRNLSTQLENISQTNKYIDDPERDMKDSSLENYFRFLENEKHGNSSCQTCNNEICVCKIERSILLQRSNQFSDLPQTNDCNTQSNRRFAANTDYLENTSISSHEKIISSHQKRNETLYERNYRTEKVIFSSDESSDGE